MEASTGDDNRVEIINSATPMRLERHAGRLIAVSDVEMPKLSSEIVRETLEQVRRRA